MLSYNRICDYDGLYVLEPRKFVDERGYFQEIFQRFEFEYYTNTTFEPVQVNESCSKFGVVRGLHFQKGEFEQAKLVRCTKGAIIDVALDMRKDSFSYGKLFSIILSEQNNKQLFIPKGFAHGFIAITENSVIRYLTDKEYAPAEEGGVLFDDEYIHQALKMAATTETNKAIIDKLIEGNIPFIYSEKDLKFQEWHNI